MTSKAVIGILPSEPHETETSSHATDSGKLHYGRDTISGNARTECVLASRMVALTRLNQWEINGHSGSGECSQSGKSGD